jgi:hypothetical protein
MAKTIAAEKKNQELKKADARFDPQFDFDGVQRSRISEVNQRIKIEKSFQRKQIETIAAIDEPFSLKNGMIGQVDQVRNNHLSDDVMIEYSNVQDPKSKVAAERLLCSRDIGASSRLLAKSEE